MSLCYARKRKALSPMPCNSLSRRSVLRAALVAAGSGYCAWRSAFAQNAGDAVDDRVGFRRVVAANRILANEGVVDAFGHVSVRDPRDAGRYVMAWARSPALVELDDLVVFEQDGTSLDARSRRPYGERMIHGAIYEARPDVNAVIHHHAYSVIPFSVTSIPLVPLTHTASVIGAHIPVWDIAEKFGETDTLVRTMEIGRDLAAALADNTCVLMRGHGAVVAGRSIQEAVLSAIYLEVNARILIQTLALSDSPIALSEREVELATETQFSPLGADRAWEYYSRRAGLDPE